MLTSKNTHLRNLIHFPFDAFFLTFVKVGTTDGGEIVVGMFSNKDDAASVNGRIIGQMVSRSNIGYVIDQTTYYIPLVRT